MTKKITLLLFTCLLTVKLSAQAPTVVELEKIIAWVDDEIILKTEFEAKEQQFTNRQSSNTKIDELGCKVFETIVINKMMIAKSKIDSIYVEDAEVEQELDRRVQQIFQVYGGDEETVLKEYGKTLEQLKAEIKPTIEEQLLIQRMQQKISSGVSITPREVKKFYRTIPRDSLPNISSEVQIGNIIRFPKPSSVSKIETRKKLEGIREQLISGQSFKILASRHSEDVVSARQGGELGFFNKGELVPEYEAMALSLSKGDISEIVETQFGFHIIQLIEKKGTKINTRHILLKVDTKPEDLITEKVFLDSIRKEILKDSLDFSVAAFKYNEDQSTKQSNGFISNQQGNIKVSVSELDPSTYFAMNKLKEGGISNALDYINPYTGEEGTRIIYLKSKTPPHKINLKDDYQKIKEAALSEKQNQEIENWYRETKKQVYMKVDDSYSHCKIL